MIVPFHYSTETTPSTPNTSGIDSPRASRFSHRSSVRSHGSMDGDIDMTMMPRHSEVEGLGGASPLRELLNYCTGISFEGFMSAESEFTLYARTCMMC